MQTNLMVNLIPISSSVQTEKKPYISEENNKFKDVFEHKRLKFDSVNETSKEKEIEKVDDEKPKVKNEETEEVSQTLKNSKKQKIHKYKKKEEEKENSNDLKKDKDMEIRTKLMELAKALGIDPEKAAQLIMQGDLTNMKGSEENIKSFVEKLATLSGVKEQEKPELTEKLKDIIQKIFVEADESKYASDKEKQEIDTQDVKKIVDTNIKDKVDKQIKAETTEDEGLKDTNNNQSSLKMTENPKSNENIKKETKDEAKLVKNQSENSEVINTDNQQLANKKDDASENEEINTDNKIEIKDDKKKTDADNEDENKNEDGKHGDWTEKVKVMFKYQDKGESSFKLQTANNIQSVQNLQDVQIDQKVQLKTSNFVLPRKEEILNQIIEKATVTLTPDKAEMVLNLKPDHLGKLEMKLITEKGVLNAQIVAENQQVKQIIESNFNILKDALEKQGIAVQGFSVSVGNHNWNREFQNSGWKGQNSSNQKQYKTNGITVSNSAYLHDTNLNNKIMWPESTVNYTA